LKAQYTIQRLHNIVVNDHDNEERGSFIVSNDSANKQIQCKKPSGKKQPLFSGNYSIIYESTLAKELINVKNCH